MANITKDLLITGKVMFVQKIVGYCIADRLELIIQNTETKNRRKICLYYDNEKYMGDAEIVVVGDIVNVYDVTVKNALDKILDTAKACRSIEIVEKAE